jgi:hypothetical protein
LPTEQRTALAQCTERAVQVRNIVDNSDGAFVDGHGAPMSPCIVMEKGESLDLWSARTDDGVDMITGLQARAHTAPVSDRCIGAMHAEVPGQQVVRRIVERECNAGW